MCCFYTLFPAVHFRLFLFQQLAHVTPGRLDYFGIGHNLGSPFSSNSAHDEASYLSYAAYVCVLHRYVRLSSYLLSAPTHKVFSTGGGTAGWRCSVLIAGSHRSTEDAYFGAQIVVRRLKGIHEWIFRPRKPLDQS